jgi:predicted nicotinamide N-methyase
MRFVRAHARPTRPPLVPEVVLHLDDDTVRVWQAAADHLGGADPGSPYWAAAWPGGQALARHVLDRPATVAGREVLDLGAGSGVVAVAAALAGARRVVASDVDPFAQAAVRVNARANRVPGIEVVGDVLDTGPAAGGVVLAGDVCYDRALSERVLRYLDRALERGGTVLVGDPGRWFLPTERLDVVTEHAVPQAAGEPPRRTPVWRLRPPPARAR